ncbi:MAG: hypothetical protein JW760_01640 [Spirochaetales bacterium]|nr:hypothetical protein [Spirochaetales bacterium]
MDHPKTRAWIQSLKNLFDEVDDYLEETYGHLYPLHPARPARGETANKTQDGLFNVGARFTPGYGSKKGRGYILEIDMVTLADVPEETIERIEDDVVRYVSSRLPEVFPHRDLEVTRDGPVFKIHGDLSLGHL